MTARVEIEVSRDRGKTWTVETANARSLVARAVRQMSVYPCHLTGYVYRAHRPEAGDRAAVTA